MFRYLPVWLKSQFDESFATLALLAALFFSGILVILVVYRPIHEAIMLRYYYAPEEIRRDNLRVVEIVAKRDIIFSNGERRAYETGLKVLFVGIAGGLTLAWVAVGLWAIARFNRRFPPPSLGEEQGGVGGTTAEPAAAPDRGGIR